MGVVVAKDRRNGLDHAGVVIVGAGAAGATAAGTLRHGAFEGPIVVVQAEPGPPYNRTTVSKSLLEGTLSLDAVTLPEAAGADIEWTGPDRATALDPRNRTVSLTGGRSLHYDHLVVATGSSPLPFSGRVAADARDRVLTLRTAADASRLRQWIRPGATVTILGAGFIGSEAASLFAAAGATVRLVSRSATPMSPHLGPTAAAHLARVHEDHVETRFGLSAGAVEADEGGRVTAVLTDGTRLSSDVVLVSVGVRPETGWLAGAGLVLSDGVAVDDRLRARGATGVYAAGDLARITDADGNGHRVEHWNHAVAQGRHAARTLLHDIGRGDDPGAFGELPSYSTRLHGTRVNVVSHPRAFTRETVVDGDPAEGRFTVALTDEHDRLVRVVGIGGARTVNALKNAVQANDTLDAALAGVR